MSSPNNQEHLSSSAAAATAEAAAAAATNNNDTIPDDSSICDDDGYIDLNDPENMIVDDDEGAQPAASDDDEDGEEGGEEEDESRKEQLLDDNGEPLAQGANLNEEGDHLPPVDDCAVVFYDPESVEKVEDEEDEEGNPYPENFTGVKPYFMRVKALHALAVHPKQGNIFAVAGESEAVYVVETPAAEELKAKAAAKAASRPAADAPVDKSYQPPFFEYGVNPKDLIPASKKLTGHTDTVTCVAFSPVGDVIASGSIDTTVKIWSLATGECLHTLTDLSGEVECLLWHPSGLALLAGAQDAQTIMWNAKKGQVAMYYCGHRGTVTGLSWAMDYKKVLSISADGSVMLFNAKTSEVEMAITKGLSEDQAGVVSMALLPIDAATAAATNSPATLPSDTLTANSETLVVGTEDGTMFVLNLKTKKVVQKLSEVHSQAVESIVACTDPAYITICPFFVSVSCDCHVAVWNARDFSLRSKVNINEGILAARWFKTSVAVGCSDGVIRFFDTRTFIDSQEFVVPHQKEKRFGDNEEDEEHALETFSNKGSWGLFGHRRMIFKMNTNVSNDALISVSDDGTARVFGL